jgi:hypothetical protein
VIESLPAINGTKTGWFVTDFVPIGVISKYPSLVKRGKGRFYEA